ncbi:MAG: TRAP transporter small permease [Spirochaetia bacterium]|nr:TRAP transporter small permease [Spirochaetia bacterium]
MKNQNIEALKKSFYSVDKVIDIVDKMVQIAIVIIFGGLFVLLNVQVVMRYVVQLPIIWIEEFAGFLLAYLTLWGSSVCIRTDRHIRVSYLLDILKLPAARHTLSIVVHLLIIFFLYYLIVYGYQFAAFGKGMISPSGTFDNFWPRLSLISGGVLMLLQAVGVIFRELIQLISNSQQQNNTAD